MTWMTQNASSSTATATHGETRLDGLEDERIRELASIADRYAGVRELVFPLPSRCACPMTGPGQ